MPSTPDTTAHELAAQPLIINLAPTGMVPTRASTPHVPLTPTEIVADVGACIELGAAMVHLHARDAAGVPTDDAAIYADIVTGLRERHPATVIITTTSGRRFKEVERRASTLTLEGKAKPDMASLTLGSMNFASEASMNDPATIQRLAAIMRERGIRPELEVFDLGMINYAKVLIDKGLLEPPFYFNILLGNIATAQANLSHLAVMVADLPPQSFWSLAGIGRFQAPATALGATFAHGVRVGLEDNLWLDAGRTRLATNAALVRRALRLAEALERPIATPGQVRQWLQLPQPPQ
jgi:uncharacterized protein (DUF849 family)